ncbi:hypothetical protein [Halolamina sp.]|uniref:hypothetical protein n=1 Tax=Halolamina sp. TaxID=1940283 RepID=UPI00356799BD
MGKTELAGIGSGIFGVLGTLYHLGIVWIPDLHTALIPLAFTLAPEIPALPEGALQKAAIAVTAAFVVLSVARIADRLIKELRS